MVAAGVLAAGIYGAGHLLAAKGLDWADKVSGVVSVALTLLGLAAGVLVRLMRRTPARRLVSEQEITQAGDDLAAALGRRLAREERLRRVHDPRPLPVRWESAVPARTASGRYDDVRAFFLGLAAPRVMFLGAAGAGKSVLVMKLARDLLDTRDTGDAVPVILPIADWDPGIDLSRWLADELTRRYPGLGEEVGRSTGETGRFADLLVAGARLIPILDGLDELPAASRAEAIAQINDLGSELPLVVTSRTDEYRDAVRRAGSGITAGTVVELCPLRVQEAEDYLREATTAQSAGRWKPLLARLNAEPDGRLAATLTTPLFLWLARTIYEDRDAEPAELADQARFADGDAIEKHLLETFIPAVYGPRTYRVDPARHRYTARQATRWLAFLAAHLQRTGTQEFAWWRLRWRGVKVGLGVRLLLLTGLGWALLDWLLRGYGWYTGSVPWRRLLLGGPLGRHLRPALDPVITWLAGKLGDRLVWVVGELLHLNPIAWLVLLAVISDPGGRTDTEPKSLRFTPLAAARWLMSNATAVAMADGLGIIAYWSHPIDNELRWSVIWSPVNRDLVLLALLLVAVNLPGHLIARVPVATDRGLFGPRETLWLDRRSDLVTAVARRLAFGTGLALLAAGRLAVAYAILAAAATLVGALLGGMRQASRRYQAARNELFLSRRLPLRLMAFLDDACERGVLRRTGPVYQFRHIRLQEHLAACHPRSILQPVLDAGEQWAARAKRTVERQVTGRPRVRTWLAGLGRGLTLLNAWLEEDKERTKVRREESRAARRRLIGRFWAGDIPAVSGYCDIDKLLDRLCRRLSARLGTDLVGLYLHGSLTTGDFHPRYSDIDLLAVVQARPDDQARHVVDTLVRELSGDVAVAADVDLEWVTTDDLVSADPLEPPRPGNLLTFATAPQLMRYALRGRGRAITGPPVRTLVPEVPWPDYKAAFQNYLDALSVMDWRATTARDRTAAVRIVCRGLWTGPGRRRMPSLAGPAYFSTPTPLLRHHFRAVRAALHRQPTVQPEALTQILATARTHLAGHNRKGPKARTGGTGRLGAGS